MADETLTGALAQATDTRRVLIGPGALAQTAACFQECFLGRTAVVVADETTYRVAGEAVEAQLRQAGIGVRAPVVFPARPTLHAEYHHATWLRDQLAAHDAVPVAVGSGTLNDLTKLASHLADRPYMVVATAASMDGYAAFGAAITRDGFKQTISCPAPRAIVADETILAAAPAAMTASGFGDLVGKVTAGADWLVADALGVEPIDAAVWEIVQPAVREALADARRLRAGDPAAVARLFRCLVMSGLAMQAARSSRPASGAEHQFSHLWEMHGLRRHGEDVSHGFKVGVGTVAVAALYERLLAHDLAEVDVEQACRRWPDLAVWEAEVRQEFAEPLLRDQALAEIRAKYLTPEQLRARLAAVRAAWPRLRRQLAAQLLPADDVRRLLGEAGCPAAPEEIGLTAARLRASFAGAHHIRRRYTALDLASETGLLESLLEALYGTSIASPGGANASGANAARPGAPAALVTTGEVKE